MCREVSDMKPQGQGKVEATITLYSPDRSIYF